MSVTHTTFFPVLAGPDDPRVSTAYVTEEFVAELAVQYSFGPPYGHRFLTWEELDESGMSGRDLRQSAVTELRAALGRVRIHGQPPALMLSFEGLESSILLAHGFWDDVAGAVPGELVVAVPARDVVIFTGTQSRPGLDKVRRAVDRVHYAGGEGLLTADLLVRRRRRWEVFQPDQAVVPRQRRPPSTAPAPGTLRPGPVRWRA